MSVKNPAPAPLATCTIHTDSGTIVVPCEPINDHLAITPTFGMDESGNTWLGGSFTITHRATGGALSDSPGCINCCRANGRAIAALPIDWSLLTSDNGVELAASWPSDVRLEFASLRGVGWHCDAGDCARVGSTR